MTVIKLLNELFVDSVDYRTYLLIKKSAQYHQGTIYRAKQDDEKYCHSDEEPNHQRQGHHLHNHLSSRLQRGMRCVHSSRKRGDLAL